MSTHARLLHYMYSAIYKFKDEFLPSATTFNNLPVRYPLSVVSFDQVSVVECDLLSVFCLSNSPYWGIQQT